MNTNWYLIEINPRGVFAARVDARDAALLLDRGFAVLLAEATDLNALALRHGLPLRVRELSPAGSVAPRRAVA